MLRSTRVPVEDRLDRQAGRLCCLLKLLKDLTSMSVLLQRRTLEEIVE